jgi:hypothetical protein
MKGLEEIGTVINRVRASHEIDVALNLLSESSPVGRKSVAYLEKELGILGVVKRDGSPSDAQITANLCGSSGIQLSVPKGNRMLFNAPMPRTEAADMWGLRSGTASRIDIAQYPKLANPHNMFMAHDPDSVFGASGRNSSKTVGFVQDIFTERTRDMFKPGQRMVSYEPTVEPLPLTGAKKPYFEGAEPNYVEKRLAEFPVPTGISHIADDAGTRQVMTFKSKTQYGFSPQVTARFGNDGRIQGIKLEQDVM